MRWILLIIGLVLMIGTSSAASTYDVATNNITLGTGDNTIAQIYSDISNNSALSYNSTENSYKLNARIIGDVINKGLIINDTTLYINGSSDDEYYIDIEWNLTVDNATIKPSSAGKRFYIYAIQEVYGEGSGFSHYINNSVIENGYLKLKSSYPHQPAYPYIRIFNLTIKDVDVSTISAQSYILYAENAQNSSIQDVILTNVTGGSTQYGGVVFFTGTDLIVKNIYTTNVSASIGGWGSVIQLGIPDAKFDDITIDGVNTGYSGIYGKECWCDRIFNVTNLTIKNINTPNGFSGIKTYLNHQQFACTVACGLNLENYYFDSYPLTGYYAYAIKHTYNLPISYWIFNASIHNASSTFGHPHDNSYNLTNVYTDSPIWDIYNEPETAEFNWYELLDIKVEDSLGNPISGATITLTPNQSSPVPFLVDKSWNNKTSLITGSDGHTPLPSNKTGMGAILRSNSTGLNSAIYYNYSISVDATGYNINNSVVITPDLSWYRSDPDIYQNTTIIILGGWSHNSSSTYDGQACTYYTNGSRTCTTPVESDKVIFTNNTYPEVG